MTPFNGHTPEWMSAALGMVARASPAVRGRSLDAAVLAVVLGAGGGVPLYQQISEVKSALVQAQGAANTAARRAEETAQATAQLTAAGQRIERKLAELTRELAAEHETVRDLRYEHRLFEQRLSAVERAGFMPRGGP